MTTTAKHSPTPYRCAASTITTDDDGLIAAVYDGGSYSAEVFGERKYSTETANANAAFIVRACNAHDDLLATLQMIVSGYEAVPVPGMETDIAAARAAIAKAQGGAA